MIALFRRDLRLSMDRGSDAVVTLFFFAVVVMLSALALGGEEATLKLAAPGIVWISAVLASLLSLEGIWHRDFEDGTFDLLLLSPVPPLRVMLAKIAAHWAIAGLSLTLAGVVASQMLFIPVGALCILIPSLLLGTLYMSLLGGFGAVLTFGTKRPGLLLALLILPLFVPMLILGVLAMQAALADLPARAYLLLQLALVVAAGGVVPPAAAAFLKLHLRSS